jgi:adenylate cyclase
MGTDERALPEVLGDDAGQASRFRAFLQRVDSKPALLSAARRLRRRLPGDEKFGDPLSTAGIAPVEVVARGVSTLAPERPSVAQELGLAGLQLWQSLSEAAGRGRGDKQLALLFTDLVGFSSWSLRAGDVAALELLRAVGTAVESAIQAHDGRIVKRLGDGVMATFLDAGSAVDAALDAQQALAQVQVDGHRPQMRAGIHWGRPRHLGGDYLGIDVNIAARVGDAAKGGEVLVSDPVLERLEVQSLEVGRSKRLRAEGAPRGLRVARVSRR